MISVVGVAYPSLLLSGTSALDFVALSASSIRLSVLDADDEPDVPVLRSVAISSDGSFIIVSFDAPMNQGGFAVSFPCAALLVFEGADDFSCHWVNARTIYVMPTSRSTELSIGASFAGVEGSNLKAACTRSPEVCAD